MENKIFKVLTDNSSDRDLFENKTHENVAISIKNIIDTHKNNALTIGLEGKWGSGKSTVISILKNLVTKPKEKDKYIYLYIDAWAHEGDPLRRIFLEIIINQIDFEGKDEFLQDKKNILSSKKKTVNIESKKAPTSLGYTLSALTTLVPFGAAIISTIPIEEVSFFKFDQPLHVKFFIGSLFALAPLAFSFFRLIVLFLIKQFLKLFNNLLSSNNVKNKYFRKFLGVIKNLKNFSDSKDWKFIGEDTTDTTTQKISEDYERSSIEFQEYFYDILNYILSLNDKQVILVIDNLDRINSQDSLKIWSTMQTFLQNKNPNTRKKDITKRLWIIIPYDENGLAKLWENDIYKSSNNLKPQKPSEKTAVNTNTDADQYTAKIENSLNSNHILKQSFFDKCFQLRFEIPFQVQTSWVQFTKNMIKESLPNLNEKDKAIVLKIFINSRESIADIPSPREIKTYINQVGVQKILSSKNNISIECIAYYAYIKFLKLKTQEEIKQGLLKNTIPDSEHITMLPKDCKYQLSGILFGVNAVYGKQLLLREPIMNALNNGNKEELKELYLSHNEGFMSIFKTIIDKDLNKLKLLQSIYAIINSIWELNESRFYLTNFKKIIKNSTIEYPSLETNKYYNALFIMINNDNSLLNKIWIEMFNNLNSMFDNNEFNAKENVEIYQSICEKYPKSHQIPIKITSSNLNNWKDWTFNFSEKYTLLQPPTSIIIPLSNLITQGKAIEDKIISLIDYISIAGEYDIKPIIEKIKNHIFWNRGIQSNNGITIKLLDTLFYIAINNMKYQNEMVSILRDFRLYNLIYPNSIYHVKYAVLLSIYIPQETHNLNPTGTITSSTRNGINKVLSIWKNVAKTYTSQLMDLLSKYNIEHIIWELSYEDNKQIITIIKKAIDDNNINYFIIKKLPIYNKYKKVINDLNQKDDKIKFTQLVVNNNSIIDEINDINSDKFFLELPFLYYIYTNLNNKKSLNDYFKTNIIKLNEDQWIQIFINEDNLERIVEIFKSNIINENDLEIEYYKAISEYINEWGDNKITPNTTVLNNWEYLFSILKKENLNVLIKNINDMTWRDFTNIPQSFIEANINFITFNEENAFTLYKYLENIIKKTEPISNEIDKLFIIVDRIENFPSNKDYIETLKPLIIEFINQHSEESNLEKLKLILKKVEIDIPINIEKKVSESFQ
ncbi:MAG: P-loop NTPase fold protein [Pleomorphochaeta sp.]